MFSYTETYWRITAKATRRARCPGCGKATTRSRTFEMTVSPFNKNPDGTVRTPSEVAAAVRAEADAWQPDPGLFRHSACMDEG